MTDKLTKQKMDAKAVQDYINKSTEKYGNATNIKPFSMQQTTNQKNQDTPGGKTHEITEILDQAAKNSKLKDSVLHDSSKTNQGRKGQKAPLFGQETSQVRNSNKTQEESKNQPGKLGDTNNSSKTFALASTSNEKTQIGESRKMRRKKEKKAQNDMFSPHKQQTLKQTHKIAVKQEKLESKKPKKSDLSDNKQREDKPTDGKTTIDLTKNDQLKNHNNERDPVENQRKSSSIQTKVGQLHSKDNSDMQKLQESKKTEKSDPSVKISAVIKNPDVLDLNTNDSSISSPKKTNVNPIHTKNSNQVPSIVQASQKPVNNQNQFGPIIENYMKGEEVMNKLKKQVVTQRETDKKDEEEKITEKKPISKSPIVEDNRNKNTPSPQNSPSSSNSPSPQNSPSPSNLQEPKDSGNNDDEPADRVNSKGQIQRSRDDESNKEMEESEESVDDNNLTYEELSDDMVEDRVNSDSEPDNEDDENADMRERSSKSSTFTSRQQEQMNNNLPQKDSDQQNEDGVQDIAGQDRLADKKSSDESFTLHENLRNSITMPQEEIEPKLQNVNAEEKTQTVISSANKTSAQTRSRNSKNRSKSGGRPFKNEQELREFTGSIMQADPQYVQAKQATDESLQSVKDSLDRIEQNQNQTAPLMDSSVQAQGVTEKPNDQVQVQENQEMASSFADQQQQTFNPQNNAENRDNEPDVSMTQRLQQSTGIPLIGQANSSTAQPNGFNEGTLQHGQTSSIGHRLEQMPQRQKPRTPQQNRVRGSAFDNDQSQLQTNSNLSERISMANVDDNFIHIDLTNEPPINRIIDYINVFRDRQTGYQKVIVRYRNSQIAQQLGNCAALETEAVISSLSQSDFIPTKLNISTQHEFAQELHQPNLYSNNVAKFQKVGPDNNFSQLMQGLVHKTLINQDHSQITAETMYKCQKLVLENEDLLGYKAETLEQADRWTFERYLLRSLVPISRHKQKMQETQCQTFFCRLLREQNRKSQKKDKSFCKSHFSIGLNLVHQKILKYNQQQWVKKSKQGQDKVQCFEKKQGAYLNSNYAFTQIDIHPVLKSIFSWFEAFSPTQLHKYKVKMLPKFFTEIEKLTRLDYNLQAFDNKVKEELLEIFHYVEALHCALFAFAQDQTIVVARFSPSSLRKWQIAFLGEQAIERLIVVGQCAKAQQATPVSNKNTKHPFAIVNLTEGHANLVLTYEDIRANELSEQQRLPFVEEYKTCSVQAVPLLLEIILNGLQVLKTENLVTSSCLIQSIVFIDSNTKRLATQNESGSQLLFDICMKDVQRDFFAPDFAVVKKMELKNFALVLDVPVYTLVCYTPYKYEPLTTYLVTRCASSVSVLREFNCLADTSHQLAQYGFLRSVFAETYNTFGDRLMEIQETRRRFYHSEAMWCFSVFDQFQIIIQSYLSLQLTQQYHPQVVQDFVAKYAKLRTYLNPTYTHEINVQITNLQQQFQLENFTMSTIAYETLRFQLAVLQDAFTVGFSSQINHMRAQQTLLLYQLCSKLRQFNSATSPEQIYSVDETSVLKTLIDYQQNIVPVNNTNPIMATSLETSNQDNNVTSLPARSTHQSLLMPGSEDIELPSYSDNEVVRQNGGSIGRNEEFVKKCCWKNAHISDECQILATICKIFTCVLSTYRKTFNGMSGSFSTKGKPLIRAIKTCDGVKHLRTIPLKLNQNDVLTSPSGKDFCRHSISVIFRILFQDVISKPSNKLLKLPSFDDSGKTSQVHNPLIMTTVLLEQLTSNVFQILENEEEAFEEKLTKNFDICLLLCPEHSEVPKTYHVPRYIALQHCLQFIEEQSTDEMNRVQKHVNIHWMQQYFHRLQLLPSAESSFNDPEEYELERILYMGFDYDFLISQVTFQMGSYNLLKPFKKPQLITFVKLLSWLLCNKWQRHIIANCEHENYWKAICKVIVASKDYVENLWTTHETYRLSCAEVKYHFALGTLPLAYLQEIPILAQDSNDQKFVVQFVFWDSLIIKSHNFEPKIPNIQTMYSFNDFLPKLTTKIEDSFVLQELKDPTRNSGEQLDCTKFILEVRLVHNQLEESLNQDLLKSLQQEDNHKSLLQCMVYKHNSKVQILAQKKELGKVQDNFQPIETVLKSLHSFDTQRSQQFFYVINFFTTRTITNEHATYEKLRDLSKMGKYYASLEIDDNQLPAVNPNHHRYDEKINRNQSQQKYHSVIRPIHTLVYICKHLVLQAKITGPYLENGQAQFKKKYPQLRSLFNNDRCFQKFVNHAIEKRLKRKRRQSPYE